MLTTNELKKKFSKKENPTVRHLSYSRDKILSCVSKQKHLPAHKHTPQNLTTFWFLSTSKPSLCTKVHLPAFFALNLSTMTVKSPSA